MNIKRRLGGDFLGDFRRGTRFATWNLMARVALFFLCLTLETVLAAPMTMPVDEVQPGMRGIAKTVVAGNQIEEFSVEVLGILKQKGPSGDLILIRASGDVVARTGGIAQGMSGSPVYIHGKLVGAIGYGWSFTDHKTGMVTPIADMLKLWELPLGKSPVVLLPAPPPDETKTGLEENLPVEKMSTPLLVSGFGEKSLALLKERLRPYKLVPYAVGGDMGEAAVHNPLEPGSPVGVQLLRGDVSVGALGTVTYVEDGRVLAFGHPFLKRGNANYFMTAAQVLTTMSGVENSFKVGLTGEPIGVIEQDRGAGISGRLGVYPAIIPISVTVLDKNLGQIRELNAQMVNDEELAPVLGVATTFNAVEKTSDRVGSGTARVKLEISSADLPGEVLKRDNMFYSPANIGELAVAELFEGMVLLANNPFKPVDITDIKVSIEVESERKTASIQEAKTTVLQAKPGDKVPITVKLKPFRGEVVTRQIFFVVPKDQPAGAMTLVVRGGGMIPLAQILARQQGGEDDGNKVWGKSKPKSLEEAVRELSERDRNNDIVVEVLNMEYLDVAGELGEKKLSASKPANRPKPQPPQDEADSAVVKPPTKQNVAGDHEKGKRSEENNKKFHLTTDYIIDNVTQVMLNVAGASSRAAN